MSAPKGNQYAKQAHPKESMLNIRILTKDKARWVRAAQKKCTNLSKWVIAKLNSP